MLIVSLKEIEPKKKTVSDMIFSPDIFERFLKGEVGSVARKTEHAVYNVEEERARRQAAAEERERQRQQSLENSAGEGDDYSDEESFSDEEY